MATQNTDTTNNPVNNAINNAGPSPGPREAHPSAGGDLYQIVTDKIIALI